MPYRIKSCEAPGEAVQRILREQLERAVEGFSSLEPDAAIHKARRRLKKSRAALRLIRPGLTHKAYQKWNGALRDVGLLMSNERDLFVIQDVIDQLNEKASTKAKPALSAVRALTVQTLVVRDPAVRDLTITAGIAKLQTLLVKLDRLPAKASIADVANGYAQSQRECRATFALAFENADDEAVHEWRKSVQRHWRQSLLLRDAWPQFFDARTAMADPLAGYLGADHDLAILKHFAAARVDKGLSDKQVKTLCDLAQEKQDELRELARPLGEMLNAASPKELAREVRIYWTQLAPSMEDPAKVALAIKESATAEASENPEQAAKG